MNRTKFSLRLDSDALETAKQYAEKHQISLTELVESYFRALEKVNNIPVDTPILNQLIGSLKTDTSLKDYHEHLEEKYLGRRDSD
jgi:antitoxin component of RelBE/YafQ-DinJ toxin-antitoxin module